MHNLLNSTMSKRREMVEYAKSWIGRFYKWGGDDPSGFDCSGYVLEILKSVGLFPRRQDMTANQLLVKFTDPLHPAITKMIPGALVFWVDSNEKAYHIEMAIDHYRTIGASGGGSNTKTESDAIRDNAFIKIRPLESITGPHIILDPLKGAE